MTFSVHPRACGERLVDAPDDLVQGGSSPRLRGTPAWWTITGFGVRFIPAPAGNAAGRAQPAPHWSVHPRACGERVVNNTDSRQMTGSSPRLRGTQAQDHPEPDGLRFIPAPAGNATRSTATATQRTVHPRACGERAASIDNDSRIRGSSPRLRGTHLALSDQRHGLRFIPAPAGNACSISSRRRSQSVHPRACGERREMTSSASAGFGSSPRLRGTLIGSLKVSG